MSHYKLNKKCKICNKLLLDNNKSGFCNTHRDRTGTNNSFYGKKHKKETIEKSKLKISKKSKKLWQNKEYRNKVIKGISKPRKESFKKEQSIRIEQWYKDKPEQRQIRSKRMKENWANEKIVKNNNMLHKDSKVQKIFFEDIKNILPNIVKKTIKNENRWFFPDSLEEKSGIIIEFYGNYWHADPKKYSSKQIVHHNYTAQQIWNHDEKRIKSLENLGYKVIIVWEKDYKNNKQHILKSLDNLINWESCAL